MAGCFGSDPYDRYLERLVDEHCDDSVSIDRRDLRALEEQAELLVEMTDVLKGLDAILTKEPGYPGSPEAAKVRTLLEKVEA